MKTLLMKLLARKGCFREAHLTLPSFSWQCDIVPISEMLYVHFSFCKPLKWKHQSSPWKGGPNPLPSTSKTAGCASIDRHLPEISAEN